MVFVHISTINHVTTEDACCVHLMLYCV